MIPLPGFFKLRVCLVILLMQLLYLLPGNAQAGKSSELEPLRLSFRGASVKGPGCEMHPPSASDVVKDKRESGRPKMLLESEHRPVTKRAYYFKTHRREAIVKSYVRRPDGEIIQPELLLGYNPNVSFSTPLGEGPIHGANSVYVVEEGVAEKVFTIRTAKWITMHHSCSWGHKGKFDKNLTVPQPLETIPFEIVINDLWDTNFHLKVTSGHKLKIAVLSFGKPVAGATVSLSSEMGWTKTAVTDKNGFVSITLIRDYYPPLWSAFERTHRGEFLVTADYITEEKGSFRGTSYESVHYLTTLPWQYTTSPRDYASYSYGLTLGLLGMTVSGFGVFIYRRRRRKPYKSICFDE